jgi:histidyl-tRNA synthetase
MKQLSRLVIPPGTADIFGAKMRLREHALRVIEQTYKQFGFEPLSTPVLENAVVFDGHHGEGEKLLFNLNDKYGNSLVLRYDLTVPLARVMGMYPQIIRPFKRYQLALSFRDDEPDKGHFREFIQCDADAVGIFDLTADAEVIMMAAMGLKKIGFDSYIIRVNHRCILKAIAEEICGYNCDALSFQRSLDFADKVLKQGIDGIKLDLSQKGFSQSAIDRLLPILDLKGDPMEVLDKAFSMLMAHVNAGKGVHELRMILSHLPKEIYNHVEIDFTLARGADYYTGFILEGVIPDIAVGAVLGGGRYDNLIAAAGGNSEPAVGMAFGLERIITAMEELSMVVDDINPTVLLYGPDKHIALAFAHQMRGHDVMVDFNPNLNDLSEATEYAQVRNYPAIVHCHENVATLTALKDSSQLFFQKLEAVISAIS